MTDKQTIEYVRPEGLPEDAVPFVAFVGVADECSGFFPTYFPNGQVWTRHTESLLRHCNVPVPERTYGVTVQLTEAEVRARAEDFQGQFEIIDPYVIATRKYNNACRAAIEAGEA